MSRTALRSTVGVLASMTVLGSASAWAAAARAAATAVTVAVSTGGGPFIESYIAPDMHMRPVGETVRMIEEAGFEVIGVEAMREHYAPPSAPGWPTSSRTCPP